MRISPILAVCIFAACGNSDKNSAASTPPKSAPAPSAPAAPSAPPVAAVAPSPAAGGDAATKAKEIFAMRCVPCHGAMGAGDGAASASLDPKPRKFGDPEWQKSVTDDHIIKIIKFGGAAVGKAPTMPGNPDLTDITIVTALKDVVRGFGK